MAKVLALDNDRINLIILCKLLEKEGHAVSTAMTTQEALYKLESGPDVDVIITDLLMPPPDGFDFLNVVSQLYPSYKFIAATSYMQNDIFRSRINKLRDRVSVLNKPFMRDDLLETFNSVLEHNLAQKATRPHDIRSSKIAAALKRLYESTEVKPGFAGVSIDLKKLLSQP